MINSLKLFLLVLVGYMNVAAGDVGVICPSIPKSTNVVFEHKQGPDFDLCYARYNNSELIFGLYAGLNPDFTKPSSPPKYITNISKHTASWYEPRKGSSSKILETLIEVDGASLHIWILENQSLSVEKVLELVKKIQI